MVFFFQNSIRHNLSLHNRFMRVQNEGTGKSSWWQINPEAKPGMKIQTKKPYNLLITGVFFLGKSVRRRAASMETSKYEKRRGRAKKRVEQLRSAGLGGMFRKYCLKKRYSRSINVYDEISIIFLIF